MAEYVDKEIVKEAIGMIAKACIANPRITCGEIQTFFEGIPTADVRSVLRGHWERTEGDSRFMCSVCKGKEYAPTIMGQPTVWDYCPNCGAWMKGGDADG